MPISADRRLMFAATILALLLPTFSSAQKYHRTDLTTNSSTVSNAPNVDGSTELGADGLTGSIQILCPMQVRTFDFYKQQALTAEAGKFDFVFIADSVSINKKSSPHLFK